ncbi:hypothetical protein J6590_040714 [Homalodisca vitripennis]|nr:hypothetical protein J6590_040714 [Homalodisca vitripennis]
MREQSPSASPGRDTIKVKVELCSRHTTRGDYLSVGITVRMREQSPRASLLCNTMKLTSDKSTCDLVTKTALKTNNHLSSFGKVTGWHVTLNVPQPGETLEDCSFILKTNNHLNPFGKVTGWHVTLNVPQPGETLEDCSFILKTNNHLNSCGKVTGWHVTLNVPQPAETLEDCSFIVNVVAENQ